MMYCRNNIITGNNNTGINIVLTFATGDPKANDPNSEGNPDRGGNS